MWILGTDVLDGRYGMRPQDDAVEVATHAAAAKVPTAIISFSFDAELPLQMRGLPIQSCLRPRTIGGCERFAAGLSTEPAPSSTLIPALGRSVGTEAVEAALGVRSAEKLLYGRVNSYASAYGATLKRVAESQTGTAVHVRNSLDMVLLIMGSAPKQAPMQATLRWVKEQKSEGRLVIATNLFVYEPGKVPRPPGKPPPSANQTSHRPHSMKEHAVFFANELCAAAKITSTPLSFLMVPHDFREHRMHGEYKDDGKYLASVATRMGSVCGARVLVLNDGQKYEPTESAFVLQSVDGTVSGLMHLLILSASAGTPGLALVNQHKFVAFQQGIYPVDAKMEGSDNCVYEFTDPGVLSFALERFTRHLVRHQQELASRLPHMKLLAARNFDMLTSGRCNQGAGCAYEQPP